MGTPSAKYKPWIWRHMLVISLLCALCPAGLLSLVFILQKDSSMFEEQIANQVYTSQQDSLELNIAAHSDRISARLTSIGNAVRHLRAYAEEALGQPDFYGGELRPSGAENQTEPPITLDNPLYYSSGDDGALRRLINDGGPSAYFAARPVGLRFTEFDYRRLYATASLDPLLVQPVEASPLCSRSFIITSDDLLRTYPYYDFSLWPAEVELSKPRSFWTSAKADENGLVWTAPYTSRFENQWVIACLAAVSVGGRQAGVVGCELRLDKFADELLSLTLGPGGMCWVHKPPASADAETGYYVLSVQAGVEDYLRVNPLSAAVLPDDKHPAQEVLDESDLALHGPQEIVSRLSEMLVSPESSWGIGEPREGRFLASSQVTGSDLILNGSISVPLISTIAEHETRLAAGSRRTALLVFATLFIGLLLAFGLSLLAARRILEPIKILTQQVRQAIVSKMTSSAAIADEGEIGALAHAVQELIDAKNVDPAPDEKKTIPDPGQDA